MDVKHGCSITGCIRPAQKNGLCFSHKAKTLQWRIPEWMKGENAEVNSALKEEHKKLLKENPDLKPAHSTWI